MDETVAHVLTAFRIPPHLAQVRALASGGGFSGAELWRVTLPATQETFCLRRWPAAQAQREPLAAIHAAQVFAAQALPFVPALATTAAGETLVEADGAWWELSAWRPGVADFHTHPTPARLEAALRALARLHVRWHAWPQPHAEVEASPPAIARRLTRLETFLAFGEREIRHGLESGAAQQFPGLAWRGEQLLELFAAQAPRLHDQLRRAAQIAVPLQTCLRDVWHDHLLFSGDEVTGIVDYGAVGWDSVAGDIARLVGSLVGDDADARRDALAAYQSTRPLGTEELVLVEVCDAANVLLSGMNWLHWLLVEERQFADMDRIFARLDETLARLVHRNRQRAIWRPT